MKSGKHNKENIEIDINIGNKKEAEFIKQFSKNLLMAATMTFAQQIVNNSLNKMLNKSNTDILLNRILNDKLNQRDIAKVYRRILKSKSYTNWKDVNKAIVKRWSMSGLKRIKYMAWSGINRKHTIIQKENNK